MEKIEITQEELQRSLEELTDTSLDELRKHLNQAGCFSYGDYGISNRKTPLYDLLVVLRRKATDEAKRREVIKRERNKEH